MRPASFAWGEKGVWPILIGALVTAECRSNFMSRKIRNFHMIIQTRETTCSAVDMSGLCLGYGIVTVKGDHRVVTDNQQVLSLLEAYGDQ